MPDAESDNRLSIIENQLSRYRQQYALLEERTLLLKDKVREDHELSNRFSRIDDLMVSIDQALSVIDNRLSITDNAQTDQTYILLSEVRIGNVYTLLTSVENRLNSIEHDYKSRRLANLADGLA